MSAPTLVRAATTALVIDAMLTDVKLSSPASTVGQLRRLFTDPHVHAAVLVADGVLLTVLEREDLRPHHRDDEPAAPLGGWHARVVGPQVDLADARRSMLDAGRRRLAVVGADGTFLGLLCLKRTRTGFCSDRDVRARSAPAPMS